MSTLYQKTPAGIYAIDVVDGLLELRIVEEMPAPTVKEKVKRKPRTTDSDRETRREYYHRVLKYDPVFMQKQRDAAERRRQQLKDDPVFIAKRKVYAASAKNRQAMRDYYDRMKNEPAFAASKQKQQQRYQESILYARKMLLARSSIDPSLLTPELIEAKRLQLLIERKCREERNRTA